ncbi:MAG: hypothetical protein IT204_26275 [Fimbriimonadaceae bacterium]|nr:hypothetical protein [Fimbriimonadaceae bacterium]
MGIPKPWQAFRLCLLMLCVQAVAPAQEAPAPLLDPDKPYSVRYDAERQLVVWSATPDGDPLWTAPVHDYVCHAVDADGYVWVLEVAKATENLRSYDLERLPSPTQPFYASFEAVDFPGIKGAELLRDCLQRLSSLKTGAGGQLISPEVLPGLNRPEFDTGPGPDVNFPRPLPEREAAATRLRNSCLEILNGQLATFTRTYCAYELLGQEYTDDARNGVFPNRHVSAQARTVLTPLVPIPVGARPAEEVTAWRSGKWLKLPLAQRLVVNVLLVQGLLEDWASREMFTGEFSAAKQPPNFGAVVLKNVCRASHFRYSDDEIWSLLPGKDPWDGSAILSVINTSKERELRNEPRRRRQAVVSLDGRLVCPSISVACDGDLDAHRKWAAVMLAEAAVQYSMVYRDDLLWLDERLNPWLDAMADDGKSAKYTGVPASLPKPWIVLWRFLEKRQHYLGSSIGQDEEVIPDPTALSRQALRGLKINNLLEWFELPEGDVFALSGRQVLVFPQGGRPTVLRDGVVLAYRQPWEPLPSNDVYPPAAGGGRP